MNRLSTILVAALAACLMAAGPAAAATLPADFDETPLASGLTQPTMMAWAPDGRMFVAEKPGVLKVVAPGTTSAQTVLDLRDDVNSFLDRGLLGLAVDSQFATNGYVYLLYTYEWLQDPGEPQDTDYPTVAQLRRVKLGPLNEVVEQQVILGTDVSDHCEVGANDLDCIPSNGRSHSIGTIRSAPDGTLYVGAGDSASYGEVDQLAFRALDEQSLAGKILHVDRDGNGLAGHAFCPGDTDLTHVCTKVHSKGFRNPFRFQLRPSGGLVVADVGWNDYEELNVISEPGHSYGWPCYEASQHTPGYRDLAPAPSQHDCSDEYAAEGTPDAVRLPGYEYSHDVGYAIIAGPTYTSDEFPAEWQGSIFVGDYVAGFVKRLTVGAGGPLTEHDFGENWHGVGLEQTPNGRLAYPDFGDGSPGTGSIVEISYGPGNGKPVASAEADVTSGEAPLSIQFDGTGSSDPDDDALSYSWDFDDGSATSSAESPSHVFDDPGVYDVTLTVSDGRGKSDTASVRIQVGTPPDVSIEGPTTYRDGEPLGLTATATDAEEGSLGPEQLQWHVVLIHGEGPGAHDHFPGDVIGPTLSTVALVDHDADSHYLIELTATDDLGLETTVTRELTPETVPLTLRSDPPGAPLSYGGNTLGTPFDGVTTIGFHTSVSAAQTFQREGRTFAFASWSNGSARVHNLVVPEGGVTLTALYTDVTPPPTGSTPTNTTPTTTTPKPPADVKAPKLGFKPSSGVDKRTGTLKGSVSDPAGVRVVQVAVALRTGKKCRWWKPSKGPAKRASSCAKPGWLTAQVQKGDRWRLRLKRTLPAGRYRVLVRATDRKGNRSPARAFSFAVGKRR